MNRNNKTMIITFLLLMWPMTNAHTGNALPQLLIGISSSLPAQGNEDVRPLGPGDLVKREMTGGESHTYLLTLAQGQYVQVGLGQYGIDVVITMIGPDGRNLVAANIAGINELREFLSLVTESSGVYRVEIRPVDKTAVTGRYEVTIEVLRSASAEDRSRVLADRCYIEAMHLRAEETVESLRKAVKKFAELQTHWQGLDDRARAAEALIFQGEVYYELSEYQKAIDIYQQALSIWRITDDPSGEGWALNNLAAAYNAFGEKQRALETYQESLRFYQAKNNTRGLGIAMTNIGATYASIGEKQKALDYLMQALPHWRAIKDRSEARALHHIGAVYASLGDNEKALDYYNQALPLWRAMGERVRGAMTLNGIGLVYASMNEHQQAVDYLGHALQLRHDAGDRRGEAYTLNSLGSVYASTGEQQKAIDHYGQALSLWQIVGDRYGEAIALNNLGLTYYSIGDKQRAREHYDLALPLRMAVGDREGEANTRFNLARVRRDLGELEIACDEIEAALKLVEEVRMGMVSQELRASYMATVQDYYDFYIDLLMHHHERSPTQGFEKAAFQISERARARSLLETLAETRVDIRQGVAPLLVERERHLQKLLNTKVEYQIRLLSGNPTEEQKSAVSKEIVTLTTEYQEIKSQVRATSPRYAALTQIQPVSIKEIQRGALDKNTMLLEYALGEERSYLWTVTSTAVDAYLLPKRAEIEKAAQRVRELLTVRNQCRSGETVEQKQARVRLADAQYPQAAMTLSRMLLQPVAHRLGTKRLLVVTQGGLQFIPFAALPAPEIGKNSERGKSRVRAGKPLIIDHEIVHLPSASVLAALRRDMSGRKAASQIAAVLADPVFSTEDERVHASPRGNLIRRKLPDDVERNLSDLNENCVLDRLPRLRGTRWEGEEIIMLVPPGKGKLALDFTANRATAVDPDLSNYRILHFATHAFINTRHPELSGIVLSLIDEKGQDQNGFLPAHEIYNLKLPADLVVLSACQTGLGKEVRGEGLMGLTRGFMYAGAPRVVVSLWSVNDNATADLMVSFYRSMLGAKRLTAAAALRAAQIGMWRRGGSARDWGAFVLQGEWK